MKLKDIAKDCGVHYQKAARFARALMAERGEEMVWGHDFDEATAATLKERILAKASPKEILIRSTAAQRLEWSKTWRKALAEADGAKWAYVAAVLACISISGDGYWLKKPLGPGAIGDYMLFLTRFAAVDGMAISEGHGAVFTGFTGWLHESGFKVPILEEPISS